MAGAYQSKETGNLNDYSQMFMTNTSFKSTTENKKPEEDTLVTMGGIFDLSGTPYPFLRA